VSAPGGSSSQGGNPGLNALATALASAGEPVGVFNSAQIGQAQRAAQAACLSGQPVHLVGHSLGGRAVIDIAWQLANKGIYVSDLTAIDAFRSPYTSAPPGVLTYGFFQDQDPPRGRPLGGRKANPFAHQYVWDLSGYAHLTITDHPRVASTMLQLTTTHQVPCAVLR
jgi:hypothetical protein